MACVIFFFIKIIHASFGFSIFNFLTRNSKVSNWIKNFSRKNLKFFRNLWCKIVCQVSYKKISVKYLLLWDHADSQEWGLANAINDEL